MPDRKIKKVVIASVLKPVNDTRMTEKLANTLAGFRDVSVTVIGFPSGEVAHNIHSVSLPYFHRLSLTRLTIPWIVLKNVFRVRPDLFIITTHELLFVAAVAKVITRCKVVYDVQENYFLNIKFTKAFPPVLRHIVAHYVRWKERITSSLVDRFWLAEKCYVEELPFLGNKFSVLENKARRPLELNAQRTKYQLLFSGTLAESTGVFVAIDLAKKLHEVNPNIHLIIIGFCSRKTEWSEIVNRTEGCSFIRIIGGNQLVPHAQILNYLRTASAGIIAYPNNPSTSQTVPTKLYEYLAYQLPILLLHNQRWEEIAQGFGHVYSFKELNFSLNEAVKFLDLEIITKIIPAETYWESNEPNILLDFDTLLKSEI